jgi:hypothetical protein
MCSFHLEYGVLGACEAPQEKESTSEKPRCSSLLTFAFLYLLQVS